ncbi:DegT/DnrJ/EryC1/StrS family aminotransferase [Haloferax larsenii]|uniref:dTDP-4-amino-4,6-dideoxygalactose transaminase n=1 Tax=Haloferax larsenii TaxID=302484 RepID=A0A1H7V0A5_HALLR|nr:DegT/DnrJ/EryC1/StrS family aminotransferase [Haloferax larsenii]SEM02305.1 dTDP-4-amino-4,6-dideoxygalactose transaminase [Haloferax larsenii]
MISIANPEIREEEKQRVAEVLESGMLADGPEVRKFEDEFSEYCGVGHAIATSNGTTALHAALEAVGIGQGDKVITTPFSFIATANSVRLAGAEPVFADIDRETYNLDPDAVEGTLRERGDEIDAILAVHLYGLPCDVERLSELAAEFDIPLVEDAAQAHGATYQGNRVGSFGDVACFSFYPTKNMTTGEGGMITTDREDVADAATRFVNHGRTAKYGHSEVGHNFRMTSIGAAIGRVQLGRLPDYIEARRSNAAKLSEGLSSSSLTVPAEPSDRTHVYHQYTIRVENRDALKSYLKDNGVGSGIYYPTCMHEQPVYSDINHEAPVGEQVAEEVLSLPVHPSVSESDVDHIIETIQNYEQ